MAKNIYSLFALDDIAVLVTDKLIVAGCGFISQVAAFSRVIYASHEFSSWYIVVWFFRGIIFMPVGLMSISKRGNLHVTSFVFFQNRPQY